MYVVNDIIFPALITAAPYAGLATGFNVVYRTTRIFNVAHGDLMMWAPTATIVAYEIWHLGELWSIACGVAVAIAMSLAIELVAIRRFVGQSHQYQWILSTLGASVILEQLASQPFGSEPQPFPFGLSRAPADFGLFTNSPQQVLLVGVAIAMVVILDIFYRRTSLGMRLSVVGEDIDAARTFGISPRRMSAIAMALAGVTAAAVGLTIAPTILISPDFGGNLLFYGFAAAAFGGFGSLYGGLIGSILIGLISQVAALTVGTQWLGALLFGCLIAVLLVRPWGIFGTRPVRAV